MIMISLVLGWTSASPRLVLGLSSANPVQYSEAKFCACYSVCLFYLGGSTETPNLPKSTPGI